MIDIKLLNKNELINFLASDVFEKSEFIPITRHRALSQIKNPRLQAEDTLLLIAIENDEILGYLGVLPDKILINTSFVRFGWLSCLWVDPKHRGKQIAQKLLMKSAEIWDKKLILTEFTSSAKKLYDKSCLFDPLQNKIGIRLYVRWDLNNLLPPKIEFFNKIPHLLNFIDKSLNTIFNLRFMLQKYDLNGIQFNYIETIDEEAEKFIEKKQSSQIFKRARVDLNWIVKNPWVLSAKTKSVENKKYHFSSTDKSFDFIVIKIKSNESKMIGLLIFSKRNETLKLPYCYFETSEIKKIIKVIYHHISIWKIKTFTTYHSEIVGYLEKHKTQAFYKKNVGRQYLISKGFDYVFNPENIDIQDGDGDCSFT